MKAEYEVYSALEDIYLKYRRLGLLISILQQYTAECVEIVGAPEGAVDDSLFEIELEMRETNEKLKALICNGGVKRGEKAS